MLRYRVVIVRAQKLLGWVHRCDSRKLKLQINTPLSLTKKVLRCQISKKNRVLLWNLTILNCEIRYNTLILEMRHLTGHVQSRKCDPTKFHPYEYQFPLLNYIRTKYFVQTNVASFNWNGGAKHLMGCLSFYWYDWCDNCLYKEFVQ